MRLILDLAASAFVVISPAYVAVIYDVIYLPSIRPPSTTMQWVPIPDGSLYIAGPQRTILLSNFPERRCRCRNSIRVVAAAAAVER